MTLHELYEKTKADRREYEAKVANAKVEYQTVKQDIAQAQKEQASALAVNDTEAYTAAKHREDYSRDRAQHLHSVPVTSYYAPDEYKALQGQIKKAAQDERAPLWQEMQEVMLKGRDIIRRINDVSDVEKRAMNNLAATVPPRTDPAVYDTYFLRWGVENALNNMFKPHGEIEKIVSQHVRKEV